MLLSTPIITHLVLALQQASTQSATTSASRAVSNKDLETTLKTLANLVKLIGDFCDRGRWGTGIDAPRGKKSAKPVGVASDENAARVLVGNKIGEMLEVSPSPRRTLGPVTGTEADQALLPYCSAAVARSPSEFDPSPPGTLDLRPISAGIDDPIDGPLIIPLNCYPPYHSDPTHFAHPHARSSTGRPRLDLVRYRPVLSPSAAPLRVSTKSSPLAIGCLERQTAGNLVPVRVLWDSIERCAGQGGRSARTRRGRCKDQERCAFFAECARKGGMGRS